MRLLSSGFGFYNLSQKGGYHYIYIFPEQMQVVKWKKKRPFLFTERIHLIMNVKNINVHDVPECTESSPQSQSIYMCATGQYT